MSDSRFKILTYNIHKGFSAGNRHFVLHGIKDALRKVNADVLFLQEIQGEHQLHSLKLDNWPDNSQFEFLADEIWPHHAYGKNAIYNKGHHGNAILSKYTFIDWENINVSFMKKASRSLLHGTLNISLNTSGQSQTVHVICVHLGLFEHERARQIVQLINRIDSHVPHNEPLIVAGDFNDWRGIAEKTLNRRLGVEDVFKNHHGKHVSSFPSWLPILPMDRIYSRGVELTGCYSLHGHPWQRLSDHLPLVAEFRF
ncbi:Endonuclease/exonuclease/phosphatase family protein [hydrothermal vent metagenome]|uniref:Endonuclease/exonuclease/phosphatase family protein n=1 Tax=hydrothermal vent metagenome TaxID=652676 RepID=A0A3B0XMS9_9ZZZZ